SLRRAKALALALGRGRLSDAARGTHLSAVETSNFELCNPDVLHGRVLELLEGWGGWPALSGALQTFARTEVFIAGGVLRDLFSGARLVPKDFDLFLGGPDVGDFVSHLGGYGTLTAGPFGSPRWRPRGEEARYADVIPIRDFYNGLWKCSDIV